MNGVVGAKRGLVKKQLKRGRRALGALGGVRVNSNLLWIVLALVIIGGAVALFVLGAHKATPSPSPSPSPSAAPQRRRGEDAPAPITAFAQTVQDAEDAMATSDAVEFAMAIAMADEPTGVPPEMVRSMVISNARTMVVSAATESLSKMSMKAITQLVVKKGGISAAAKAKGAAAGALLLADTLYRCLADESYGERRTETTCTDQGYIVAGALLSPTSMYDLAKRGKGLARRAAAPLSIRAAKTASRFAAKASSVAAKLSVKLGNRVLARVGVAMARFSTRMTSVAARIAARAAVQASTQAARWSAQTATLGPVGVALIVLELVFMVVTIVLDSLCLGNFGEDCHVTAAELEQLNRDQTQMMIAAMEASELVDLILEENTDGWTGYAEARAYMRGAYVSRNKQNISRIFGADTIADWFAGLSTSDVTPADALGLITEFKRFVDEQNNTAIYDAEVRVPCAQKGGTVVDGVCAANKPTCLAYIDAVASLVGPHGAAFGSAAKFATVQLSILFTSSMRLAVDLHRDPTKAAKYSDRLIDSVARCIRKVSGRVATFADAIGAMRAVDADVADEIAEILEPGDWTVVDDTFAARAKWAHESAHVRRESFRWVERVQDSLLYLTPTEARASANTRGVCMRDSAAAMNLHVCPYIVADTKKSGNLKYVVDDGEPGHAVNWKTGACTRTARYCRKYDMQDIKVSTDTLGDTLTGTNRGDVERACSESDDRRAVCTCGKSGGQKVLSFLVGDTIQGYVSAGMGFIGDEIRKKR